MSVKAYMPGIICIFVAIVVPVLSNDASVTVIGNAPLVTEYVITAAIFYFNMFLIYNYTNVPVFTVSHPVSRGLSVLKNAFL
jgi:hypothetical protein